MATSVANRIARFFFASASLVCALALMGPPASAGMSVAPVVVSALHGEVRVTSRGVSVKPVQGMVLGLPAIIRTSDSGSIELRQGETIVSAAPNSELEIPLSSDPAETLDRITQSRGNVYYSIAKRAGSKLRVETRYLVAVIKGTQFNVSVTESSSTLSLLEGRVELHSPDGSDVAEINAGQVGTLSAGQSRIRVVSLTTGEVIRSQVSMPATEALSNSDSTGAGRLLGASGEGSSAVPGLSVAAEVSAGNASDAGLMASNLRATNASEGVAAAGANTVGALQALAARTNANSGAGAANAASTNAGNASSNAGNASANAGNASSNAGNASANAGSASSNAGNASANAGSSSAADLVQDLQNLANSASANGKSSGKGKP